MQTAAVRHRPESEDCYLVTTETMKLRLHTGRDVKAVYVHYCDVHEPLTNLKKQAMDLAGHGQVKRLLGNDGDLAFAPGPVRL
jgi:cyclomaltodextrinase / maltogenic alpha-amylase / neopullulanase